MIWLNSGAIQLIATISARLAQLSIAISLKRIADAMEKDAMDCSRSMEIKDGVKTVWRTEKGATHSYSEPFPPPPGDSTAEGTPVRPVDMAKQPQCTLWQRIKRAILHPTNFIQDDGSHSW